MPLGCSTHLHSVGKRDVSLGKMEAVYRGSLLSLSNMPEESQSQNETLKIANFPKIQRAAIFPIIHTLHACVGFNEMEKTFLISLNTRAGNVT